MELEEQMELERLLLSQLLAKSVKLLRQRRSQQRLQQQLSSRSRLNRVKWLRIQQSYVLLQPKDKS